MSSPIILYMLYLFIHNCGLYSPVSLCHVKQALLDLSGLLKSSLRFSLDYSARPLMDFLPHQKILWTMDAWESVQGGYCCSISW